MPPVMAVNDDLPIRTDKPIHSGKVRAVYWLTAEDSKRLIQSRKYNVAPDAELAVMVISDRISAYECIWRAKGGLTGVPGKGAALNAISNHWFQLFKEKGLADSHILEVPHPLVWVVQRAQPVMIEAIIRSYITGSMWRDYGKGSRNFCGIDIPDGLQKDSKLPSLLVTPSTKGILKGIPGVPEIDDVNVSRETISSNYAAFHFASAEDIPIYERLLTEGFNVISEALAAQEQLFVDTKFEFGERLEGGWAHRALTLPPARVHDAGCPLLLVRRSHLSPTGTDGIGLVCLMMPRRLRDRCKGCAQAHLYGRGRHAGLVAHLGRRGLQGRKGGREFQGGIPQDASGAWAEPALSPAAP